jgi:hypothetical protein
MSKEIKILLTLKSKFVSVNSLYNCRLSYVAGKPKAVMYKNPEAIKVESEIKEQLRAVDFSDYIDWLKSNKQYELNLKFILKKNVTHKDASNLIKSLEDIWTRFVKDDLGVDYDDSMHVKVTSEKSYIPNASNEYALLVLRESHANIRYDIEPKPEKIWIADMSLEDITKLLPSLPKKLKKKEKYLLASDYDTSDTKIYILDPNKFKSYYLAEIYKDVLSAVYSGFGFIYIGILGNEDDWKENWESIIWIKDRINEQIDDYTNLKIDSINEIKDIIKWIK